VAIKLYYYSYLLILSIVLVGLRFDLVRGPDNVIERLAMIGTMSLRLRKVAAKRGAVGTLASYIKSTIQGLNMPCLGFKRYSLSFAGG
jgi:hypothetical protein